MCTRSFLGKVCLDLGLDHSSFSLSGVDKRGVCEAVLQGVRQHQGGPQRQLDCSGRVRGQISAQGHFNRRSLGLLFLLQLTPFLATVFLSVKKLECGRCCLCGENKYFYLVSLLEIGPIRLFAFEAGPIKLLVLGAFV